MLPMLKSCLRFGLDPVVVAERLRENETLLELLNAIEEMSVTPEDPEIKSELHQIGEIPAEMHKLFGGGIPPILPGKLWVKRICLSMIMGICPIFLVLFPQISEIDLFKFLAKDEHDLKSLEEGLSLSIQSILED